MGMWRCVGRCSLPSTESYQCAVEWDPKREIKMSPLQRPLNLSQHWEEDKGGWEMKM